MDKPYIPYGDEWQKELMKWSKRDIVSFLRDMLIIQNIIVKTDEQKSEVLRIMTILEEQKNDIQ